MDKSRLDPEIALHPTPDTGAILTAYFKKKRIYRSGLGRALGKDYKAVRGYETRSTILTSVLWELCIALKHNFFADIAALLPAEYGTDAPADTTKDDRIKELETALLKATAERDILLLAIGKGQ